MVIVARERNGKTLTFVTKTEDAAIPTILERVVPGSTIYADEAAHWDRLHARYLTKRINHSEVYSDGEQFMMVVGAAASRPVSRQWKGYWQRRA